MIMTGMPIIRGAMQMVKELTMAESIALEIAKWKMEEEYGEFESLVEITPGHAPHDENGVCPTCGKIQSNSAEFERRCEENRLWWVGKNLACFEYAAYIVDMMYYSKHERGKIFRAVYGVPHEGEANCWMS